MTDTAVLAAVAARDALADAYRAHAAELLRKATALAETPVELLAEVPVSYHSRSTRALEDALDEALTAL